MKKILSKNISILKLENDIMNRLLSNHIDTILKLCNYTRMKLTELGFQNEEIKDIIIELQLLGLDLKKNHAKRNKSIK